MRRLFLVLATIGVAVLLASGAALAINNGTADTRTPYRYPYVGALVDEGGVYCSGTLISPDVFLTAAHCYPLEGDTSYVTFDSTFTLTRQESKNFPESVSSRLTSGQFIDDPDGTDIAVVKLTTTPLNQNTKKQFTQAELPSLPKANQLSSLNLVKGDTFTAVGYGGSLDPNKVPGGPSQRLTYSDTRAWGLSTFNTLGRTYLRLSQKNGGGTCYGDSGGPNFVGEYPYPNNIPVIASTTITGDSWCQTSNVTLRLDTVDVRNFLGKYVTLP